ncbi:MAG: WbqC family protein [Bacteroidales bacterium]|nr:WbqC family protein [Bacteroidales bacterium]
MTLIPLTYFGPISWWKILLANNDIVFDIYENYIKQTYRNRCSILSANGLLNLSIPVKKTNGNHTVFKDIKVENNQNWQHIHYKAIMSAYKASPFYDYYIDDIQHIWTTKYDYLLDVCLESINIISKITKTTPKFILSDSYITANSDDSDFRKSQKYILESDFTVNPYTQVFSDRFNFISDLSILDKIFNTN